MVMQREKDHLAPPVWPPDSSLSRYKVRYTAVVHVLEPTVPLEFVLCSGKKSVLLWRWVTEGDRASELERERMSKEVGERGIERDLLIPSSQKKRWVLVSLLNFHLTVCRNKLNSSDFSPFAATFSVFSEFDFKKTWPRQNTLCLTIIQLLKTAQKF